MKEVILIAYLIIMIALPILRVRGDSEDKLIALISYLVMGVLFSIFSPFSIWGTMALLILPVILVFIFDGVISGHILFRLLFIFTNFIIFGLVLNLNIYQPELLVFLLIIISVFALLPYKKKRRR